MCVFTCLRLQGNSILRYHRKTRNFLLQNCLKTSSIFLLINSQTRTFHETSARYLDVRLVAYAKYPFSLVKTCDNKTRKKEIFFFYFYSISVVLDTKKIIKISLTVSCVSNHVVKINYQSRLTFFKLFHPFRIPVLTICIF